MLRTALKILLLLLALALVAGTFFVGRLREGPGLTSGTLAMEGLEAPVEIIYDSMGVPHIFASSMGDLFQAQGYVHARDRLWQMEMFRRVIQGRLSEIFGARTVETDRFLRTIGMEAAARKGLPSADTPFFTLMERYSQGANGAMEGWRGLLPPEFVLLRVRPEPWTPLLIQGIEKIMAWDLADYSTGLNLAAARATLGDSALAPLMPRYPEWGVTIVEGWAEEAPAASAAGTPATSSAVGLPGRGDLPPAVPADLLASAAVPQDAARVLELGSITRASNSWVVGGELSRSGKPLVANDMHLGLEAPNIWYLVGLHAPGYDVVGMSIPGAPGVVVGHSGAVGWGYTNASLDDSDFFLERVHPEDPERYETPEGWAEFQLREEIVRVRGSDPVPFTVRSTRHGPVINRVEGRAGEELLAFRWVGHEPSGTFPALMEMGRARTAEEFLEALEGFDNPHQNVVFADTAGAWGYWMGGRVPLRASGLPPHLPVPGWTGEHDWTGWLPFQEKPHTMAPERGYVATANNAQGHRPQDRLVSDGSWAMPYRAQRISQLIEDRELHDAASLLAIQMDVGSAFARRNVPHAVRAFREAGLEEMAVRLEEWDQAAELESTEATLFHSWWQALWSRYREHYYDGGRGYFPNRVLDEALNGELALSAEMEERLSLPPELPQEAARAAAEYADLPWGQAHRLTLDHPLSGVPVAGGLLGFGRSGIPRAGGRYSVNVASFGGLTPPFRVSHGPSQRHVVDMADVDGSGGFILPGGQSGYPAGDHSFDQLPLWREGRLWLLPLARDRVEEGAVARLRLEPGGD